MPGYSADTGHGTPVRHAGRKTLDQLPAFARRENLFEHTQQVSEYGRGKGCMIAELNFNTAFYRTLVVTCQRSRRSLREA
jgi:hypothetical protein